MREGFPRHAALAGDRPPRYDKNNAFLSSWGGGKTCPSPSFARSNDRGGQAPALRKKITSSFLVGRGPVPRHAAIAGDRPPRYDKKRHFIVGRGPVPRHAFCCQILPLCSSGAPAPDLFVIRRSQPTEVETHLVTMAIAEETLSDARMASEGPRAPIKNVTSP